MRRVLGLALVLVACGGDPPRKPYARATLQGKKAVVHLVLDGEVPERSTPGFFGTSAVRSLYEWTTLLDDVRRDTDVSAIFLEIRSVGCGWACAEELASAFEAVRQSGRKVHCAIEELDDREYLFATRSCDSTTIEPAGTLWLDGLALQEIFLREALASIGLEADVLHVGRYKGAGEPFTRDSMSDELREELTQVVDARMQTVLAGVAIARRTTPENVRAAIDRGPFSAREALAAGLVDAVAFSDQVRSRARREAGGRVLEEYDREARDRASAEDLTEVFRALSGAPARPRVLEPSLVVVYASGPIVRAGDESAALFGGSSVSADEIVPLLEDLAKDENVKAVVLRVDSPGGSAFASDLIWRGLRRLDRKKPVVTSMGDTAASGGYYVAVGTRRIFADPTTLTGSIGVVGGKLAIKGLLDLAHVHEDGIQRGQNAAIETSTARFTDSERARIQALMNQTYADFVGRVATGRKMTHAQVRAIAEGRIYSGTRAKEIGLVDDLGGLETAIAWARRAGGLGEDAPVVRLPALGGMFETLVGGAAAPRTPGVLDPMAALPLSTRRTVLVATRAAAILREEPVLAILPMALDIH